MTSVVYVAFLRGVNVGGKAKVEMSRLKEVFESLGFKQITTYINSGNVIFVSVRRNKKHLAGKIEMAIYKKFELHVPVVVRDSKDISLLKEIIPASWVNDSDMKTDVLFLWDDFDDPEILDSLRINPEIEDALYLPGAIVWRVNRKDVSKSGLVRIVGTELYRNMTARNVNTVRKIYELMHVEI